MRQNSILRALIVLTFLISVICYGLGMYYPIMITGTKFIITLHTENVTIFDSVRLFFDMQEPLLGIIVLLFSIITPIVEYIAIAIRYFMGYSSAFLQQLDKWNMLDVFLVALLLLNYKMNSSFIVMSLGVGTLFIGLSVVFRVITISLLDFNTKS